MPKYLMFDHNGVLGGQYSGSYGTERDLVLQRHESGGYQVLKNGVDIVNMLNRLVEDHGYWIAFYSKTKEADQLHILNQLADACTEKNIAFPHVSAMGVYDPTAYPRTDSGNPAITTGRCHGIQMACWGADNKDGKASLRRALETMLKIDPADRGQHVVFDDDRPNIETPRSEGYQTYLIGEGDYGLDGPIPLYVAIQKVAESAGLTLKDVRQTASVAAATSGRGLFPPNHTDSDAHTSLLPKSEDSNPTCCQCVIT